MFKFKLTVLYLFFLGIILVVCFNLFGCYNKDQVPSTKITKRDTCRVMFIVKSAINGQAEGSIGRKVRVPDTLSWKEDGYGKMELRKGPDSFYLVTYTIPLTDSLGNARKDSAGRPMTTLTEVPTDKKWVRSGFGNVDSVMKELNGLSR